MYIINTEKGPIYCNDVPTFGRALLKTSNEGIFINAFKVEHHGFFIAVVEDKDGSHLTKPFKNYLFYDRIKKLNQSGIRILAIQPVDPQWDLW